MTEWNHLFEHCRISRVGTRDSALLSTVSGGWFCLLFRFEGASLYTRRAILRPATVRPLRISE